ncbi:Putative multidomain protein [Gryllus bimaculatus]|nr:Putative multidomain protein [Gryllus bimaculatus]
MIEISAVCHALWHCGYGVKELSEVRLCVAEAPPPRELVAPRYISELSERLLFAGVQLPGTRDLRGRPIVLALAAELAAAAPEAHSLAALLLYYCSLLGIGRSTEEEELEAEALEAVTSRKEVMLLVVSDSQETAALDILDRALALVQVCRIFFIFIFIVIGPPLTRMLYGFVS